MTKYSDWCRIKSGSFYAYIVILGGEMESDDMLENRLALLFWFGILMFAIIAVIVILIRDALLYIIGIIGRIFTHLICPGYPPILIWEWVIKPIPYLRVIQNDNNTEDE